MGLTPSEVYGMELWEYNAMVEGYKLKTAAEQKKRTALAWQTANFAAAAMSGKLRSLDRYIDDNEKKEAPKIGREEFEKKLNEARRLKCGTDQNT